MIGTRVSTTTRTKRAGESGGSGGGAEGRRARGGGAREGERERESAELFIEFYSFRVGFGGCKGSGMMEGIIMVNQRTALRLLSSSLLCFRGRLTRLVSRSEPLVIPRVHTATLCARPLPSLLILSLVASPTSRTVDESYTVRVIDRYWNSMQTRTIWRDPVHLSIRKLM